MCWGDFVVDIKCLIDWYNVEVIEVIFVDVFVIVMGNNDVMIEIVFWILIKDGDDLVDFEVYLKWYENGYYVDLVCNCLVVLGVVVLVVLVV